MEWSGMTHEEAMEAGHPILKEFLWWVNCETLLPEQQQEREMEQIARMIGERVPKNEKNLKMIPILDLGEVYARRAELEQLACMQ